MDSEDLKQKAFVEKYSSIDLDEVVDVHTSWEGRASTYGISPRALKRYYTFLNTTKWILLVIFLILTLVMVGLGFNFLLFTEHEIFVFDDGTDVSCIFNPSTGELKQNGK